ncbi:MAG: MATE family efflux transporter [Bacillota bacterium]|nr:MATE family efflux transporter [Bacillota bacterium]NLV62297.1 MATE family efflux transporter [Clostridiaceae bacterium]
MSKSQSIKRDLRRKMMLEDSVVKVIPIVAIPTIISMLIDSLYNITDTYFVSSLGTTATAAVGVNSSLMHLLRSVAMGFGIGAASYISRLLGAKRDEEANRVGTTTLFTGLIALMAISLIGYIFIPPIVRALGATDTVMPYSMDYARWILLSSPFTAGTVILSQLLRSEGSTKYSMIGMVSGCVVNIALDPLFIHVLGLEVAGAAIATGISKLTSFIILLMPFLKKKSILELKPQFFTPKKEIYLEIAKMGIPTFLRSSMLAVSSIVVNNVAGSFSDSALAAVTVANKSAHLVGSGIIGLSQGFQPVAGYNWGAKNYNRVRKAFWACTVMGVSASIVLGAILAVFARRLVGVFTSSDDLEILQIGSYMIITQCITMGFHTWGVISNGLFQALGRSVGAAILGLSRQLICLLPCVLILSKLFGVYGLASAQAAADILTFIVALLMTVALFRRIKRIEYENNMLKIKNQPENTQSKIEHHGVISI